MVKSGDLSIDKSGSVKKGKKFNKNSSFSGVESKKSPKNRRKSIATVLPTPLKKKKKEKTLNEWTVSESSTKDTPDKIKQIEDKDVKTRISPLKTPKNKKKKSDPAVSGSEKKIPKQKSSSPIKQKILKKEESEIDSVKKFGIEASNVTQAVKSVIKLHKENPKLKNQLFDDDPIQVYLQVCCHKVPRGPSRIIRMPLPNSLLTPDDEVCLIVPEVKGVKNIEHETHVEHYENLLRTKGVENIKKIMTFHELRTEHETFEQMSRLVDLYDAFLVDGRISGKVVKKCGKIFYKNRKVPTAVKLQATKLKEHIDKALSKAFFLLHLKGDSYSVQFGHDKMETQDLVDNVFAVIECLNKEFPGGFENIKGLHVYTTRATSIPIYSSFKIPKEVVTPKIKSKEPKGYKTYSGELTTLPNAEVTVKPTGEVIVKRTKAEEEDSVDTESKNEGKNKKNKKRKHSENNLEEIGDAAEVKDEEIVGKTKKIKKQKLAVNGSGETENAEENSETKLIVKKKKAKVNGVETISDEKVKKQKKQVDLEKNLKTTKNVDKKVKAKKNKKIKNQV